MTAHAFTPIKKEPAYLKVARAIEKDISSRRLMPGDTLPTETALSAQFGLNRSTVREGIRLLEQQGLIERGEAKRLVVAQPDMNELARRASRGLAFGGVTFREVWEALAMIQPSAAKLAAARGDKALTAQLHQITDQLQDADLQNHAATVDAATAFFAALSDSLNNRVLGVMLHSMTQLIEASLARVIDATPRAQHRILQAQRALITAIESKDQPQAELWMRRHIEDLKRGYEVAQINFDEAIM